MSEARGADSWAPSGSRRSEAVVRLTDCHHTHLAVSKGTMATPHRLSAQSNRVLRSLWHKQHHNDRSARRTITANGLASVPAASRRRGGTCRRLSRSSGWLASPVPGWTTLSRPLTNNDVRSLKTHAAVERVHRTECSPTRRSLENNTRGHSAKSTDYTTPSALAYHIRSRADGVPSPS